MGDREGRAGGGDAADIAFSVYPGLRRNALGRDWLGVIGLNRDNTGSLRRRPRGLVARGVEEANEGSGRGAMRQSATKAARMGTCVCACGLLTIVTAGCGLSSFTSG